MKASGCDVTEIGGRMRTAREALGLSQEAIAQAVGASKRGIQSNERQISVPGGEVLSGFVRLGINANWLLTGDGPMLLKDHAGPAQAVDQAMLEGVIEAIEERLHGRQLKAAKKAELIALVYDTIASGGVCEPAVLERFIRLAS